MLERPKLETHSEGEKSPEIKEATEGCKTIEGWKSQKVIKRRRLESFRRSGNMIEVGNLLKYAHAEVWKTTQDQKSSNG
jgi:hypothetical protein